MGLGEGLNVVSVVVGSVVFPHAKEDVDPLEGEGEDGRLVTHACSFPNVVEGNRSCPISSMIFYDYVCAHSSMSESVQEH